VRVAAGCGSVDEALAQPQGRALHNVEVDEVVVRSGRRKAAFGAFVGLILIGAGVNLVRNDAPVARIIGVTTLVFFGAAMLAILITIIRPMAVLTVNGDGIGFGALLPSQRWTVPWSAISGVRIYRFEAAPLGGSTRMLGVIPRDPQADIWTRRKLGRLNRRITGLPVSIADRTISIELEQVVELMRRFQPELPLEYGEPRAAGLGKIVRPSQWGRRDFH
jgi:hypothetical protein